MLTTKISSKWTNAVPSLSDPRRYPTDDMGRRRSGGHAALASVEALQIAVKREVKSKGEKERYTHLNAEFQRIARRDKKGFFSDQHKEIKKNNRMGRARDFFKKIGDTKGTFHAKMDTIKGRNGKDITKVEEIQFSSITQSCPILGDPADCSTAGSLSITNSWNSFRFTFIESAMPSSHLILCRPLLLLPPILLPASKSFPMSQLFT